MKLFVSQLLQSIRQRRARRNLRILGGFGVLLLVLVTVYTIAFHFIMAAEGQEGYSWFTGVYWTLTVMSTLGFGDILFTTDLGRVFSMIVLLTGVVFLLVLLPFTFIEFFYAPWMEAQALARAPREISKTTKGHVILTNYDEVTAALIHRLTNFHYPYVLLVPDVAQALSLYDQDIRVLVGDLDHLDTYHKARVEQAAMVVTTASDQVNTNVAITVREISGSIPVVATAQSPASVDILELAGCTHVLELGNMMGQSLARRTIGGDAMTHVIGEFDQLLIAEATAHKTPMVGKSLREFNLRDHVGVNVVGAWERGRFSIAGPETQVTQNTVLVLAGSREQLRGYDEFFCIYNVSQEPCIIIGGGRVGRATARALKERSIPYRIVEKDGKRVRGDENAVVGDAAELEVLKRAGIDNAPTLIITTNDDDMNVYLALYCRRLNPEIQVISRATRERNVSSLHRAGTDFVMSYASMGASTIFNLLKRSDIVMVTEGLDVIRMKLPASLAEKTIGETQIRRETGCTLIALKENNHLEINPPPTTRLPAGSEIIMIGDLEAEDRFLEKYGSR